MKRLFPLCFYVYLFSLHSIVTDIHLVDKNYQFFNYEYRTIVDIICSKSGGHTDMDRGSGDRVCVWSYLKRIVMSDNEYFEDIFTETLGLFMSIKRQILLSPKLALIFMLLQSVPYVCRAYLLFYLNQRRLTCFFFGFFFLLFFSLLWRCF